MGDMELKTFTMIQLADVHPRNPVTNELIPAYLQWFAVTDDMSGDTIDPTKLQPRADLHHGLTEPIPMSRIVRTDADGLLLSLGMEPSTVVRCGPK
ncbi:MAG: hypothetical protein RLY20_1882 [Verrucomicrobiota bacterium]|jgi:hypothetical protein